MSAGVKLTAMAATLVLAFGWGAFHKPADYQPEYDQDNATLDALPPLPDWAMADLPDFSGYHDTAEKKAAFFSFLYPRIVLANTRVLMLRDNLEILEGKSELTDQESAWLERQAKRLRVDAEVASPEMYDKLNRRLDVIPPSLIMAQSANESAWGTSRFATQGNNLFGQWCFTRGCGLVPRSRAEGATHEVAAFQSPYESIRAYITNLNRHDSYQALRNTREQARTKDRFPGGIALAQGLIGYSERGAAYVEEIQAMIRHNNLGYYDKEYKALIGSSNTLPELLQLATGDKAAFTPGGIAKSEG